MRNENFILEAESYKWNQFYKTYKNTVDTEDLQMLHFDIKQVLNDAEESEIYILIIKYFTDKVRFYYVKNNEPFFLELNLNENKWCHSNQCEYY